LIARWEAHDGVEVLSILYDPMKRVVLTAGNDNRIRVWSNANFRLLGEHVGHREAVTCMALDANFLFSGSDDCDIRMWDTVPGTG
jgi:WD40 repeat protein